MVKIRNINPLDGVADTYTVSLHPLNSNMSKVFYYEGNMTDFEEGGYIHAKIKKGEILSISIPWMPTVMLYDLVSYLFGHNSFSYTLSGCYGYPLIFLVWLCFQIKKQRETGHPYFI